MGQLTRKDQPQVLQSREHPNLWSPDSFVAMLTETSYTPSAVFFIAMDINSINIVGKGTVQMSVLYCIKDCIKTLFKKTAVLNPVSL
jgi:hypothetical protein